GRVQDGKRIRQHCRRLPQEGGRRRCGRHRWRECNGWQRWRRGRGGRVARPDFVLLRGCDRIVTNSGRMSGGTTSKGSCCGSLAATACGNTCSAGSWPAERTAGGTPALHFATERRGGLGLVTRRARLSKAIVAIAHWCRRHRHLRRYGSTSY